MRSILIATGIFEPDIGGPASYIKLLARNLSKNFKIKIITYSSVRKYANDKDYKFQIVRIWKKSPWFLRHVIYALKIFFSGKNSDIIYSLSALNGAIPSWLSARFFKKPFYLRIAGDYAWQAAVEKEKTNLLIDEFQKSRKPFRINFLYKIQTVLAKKADLVIVPSEYLKKLVMIWGVRPEKIKVIYNAVSLKPLDISKEEARTKIGIHGNIILSVGRLAPWKGFKMLIKIMPQLLNISQFFRLVIVGDGPDRKNLEIMVKNLGLDKKVYVIGRKNQEELKVYFAAADIFVLNSGYEGFSHQILEAMACGVPVITSAIMGNREIVHQGENGFMTKYNDEFNLIEAIKTLHQDDELKEKFIREGKKTVEFFSVEKMILETKDLLQNNLIAKI